MRDMKYYQYRQEELAEYIWKHGFQSTYVSYELKLVALYIANKYSLSEGEVAASLQEFLQRVDPEYTKNKWCVRLFQATKSAAQKRAALLQCDSIKMYNSEYLYVNSLSLDNELKKVVWTMMVQKKLDKYSYETQYETPYTIFSYTNNKRRLSALPRIAGIKKKTGFDLGIDVLHPLIESGLLEVVHTKGDPFKINFADQIVFEGKEIITVRDYEHIGLYWDFLCGEPVGFCEVCDFPFTKKAKGRTRKYCDYHAEKHSLGDSETDQVCIDCGKTFTRSTHAAMQIRCPACQKEHRRHR